MKYIVIGLGIYGRTLAVELSLQRHDVIAIDNIPEQVETVKDKVSATFVIDSTNENELSLLPLNETDAVIVAIGDDFASSLRTISLLKKKKVRHIYARAVDEIQKSILEAFDLEKIMLPEEDSARSLVRNMGLDSRVDSIPVDKKHFVFMIQVPDNQLGRSYASMKIQEKYNLQLLGIRRVEERRNILGLRVREPVVVPSPITQKVESGDELVCYGAETDYQRLLREFE